MGGSWLLSLESLIDASHGIPTVFISRSRPQSEILLKHFYRWADYLNKLCDEQFVFAKRNETSCVVNGVEVMALAHNTDTFQGFEGNVKLDEFSLQDNDDEVYANALPIATLGFKIDIIARPAGCNNRFYKIFSDTAAYPQYSRHTTTIYDAVNDGLKAKDGSSIDVTAIRRNFTEEEFREQYLCEFIDEQDSYMPYELIRSCIDTDGVIPSLTGQRYCGYDPARSEQGDNAVLAEVIKVGELEYVKEILAIRGKRFDEQESLIGEYARDPNTVGILLDGTGLGMQLGENLCVRFLNVQAVQFDNKLKNELATSLKIAFERRQIRIPDDDNLIADLHSIRKTYSGANNVIYAAKRTASGHGDRFWALALAHRAAQTPEPQFIFL